ncbi:hypothetical protein LSUB1_G007456 [Lachnellula subtilissima]|uniref:54S ribosomal protein L28, mitochondrial n=1 Tax=Lachnellula subtilissima TaxID=602034 RepID=A0A8H8U880_9HELO|nr:hypothetical protein LSUB1_G007456 [Lachnellula subtilissima]
MASSHTSLSRLLTPLLSTFRSSIQTLKPTTTSAIMPCRTFSSTPTPLAGGGGPPGRRPGGKGKGPPKDSRIKLIRYHMQHPKTPRPLKLSRMRALRHWTIHRAWMLAQRKRVEAEESELMRYDVPKYARRLRRAEIVGSAGYEGCGKVVSHCDGEEGDFLGMGGCRLSMRGHRLRRPRESPGIMRGRDEPAVS